MKMVLLLVLCWVLGNSVAAADPSSTCAGEPSAGNSMIQKGAARKGMNEVESRTAGQDKRALLSAREGTRGATVTKKKLEDALQAVKYSSKHAKKYAKKYHKDLNEQLTYQVELAMFLGQTFHESGGLEFTKESSPSDSSYDWGGCSGCDDTDDCEEKNDDNSDENTWRGKGCKNCCSIHYYGRGFIQLTWKKNYVAYGHDTDPDYASNNPMDSAIWFWKNKVLPCSSCYDPWPTTIVDYWPTIKTSDISKAQMGQATMAINPSLECPKSGNTIDCTHMCRAKHRYDEFEEIASKWSLGTPTEDSACYSASDISSCLASC